MRDRSTDDAVNDSLSDSLPSRAPADQGTREQGNKGSDQGSCSNSPSTPTSRNAPPEHSTVDGSSNLDHRFRTTVAGQTMCLTCGALVDYLDGRVLHDGWHRDGGR